MTAQFPYRFDRQFDGAQAVETLVATVRSDPAFVGGVHITGGAHGYVVELEYMQRTEGPARYRVWSDVQGIIGTDELAFPIDIPTELAALRAAGLDGKSLPAVEGSGRYAYVVIATPDGGAWVHTPTPGHGQPRGDGPLDRIFNVVFPP